MTIKPRYNVKIKEQKHIIKDINDKVVINQKFDALWDCHWRIRDEMIFRREINEKGGYYDSHDLIRKMKTNDLEILDTFITDLRQKYFDDVDT